MKKVCAAYLTHKNDREYLEHSLSVMSSYDWINQIVVLQTDFGSSKPEFLLNQSTKKVKYFGCNYGGWSNESTAARDKPVSQGGFDEISARNDLMDLAENFTEEGELVLAIDPDEIFLNDTYGVIEEAEKENASIIWFSCFHLLGFNEWRNLPIHEGLREIFGKDLIDPHPRILSRHTRLIQNPTYEGRDSDIFNHTAHCAYNWWTPEYQNKYGTAKEYATDGIYHLHMAQSYGHKSQERERGEGEERNVFDTSLLPDVYKKIMDSNNNE